MMKRFKQLLLVGLLVCNLAAVAVPAAASADSKSVVCTSISGSANCSDTSNTNINGLISLIINILSVVIGVTAVIMLMVGGFRFITANGDSNSISAARSTILYALVGLAVTAFAQIIVQFVLKKL